MWVITQKAEPVIVGPDGQAAVKNERVGLTPGDYHISEDERTVYTVAKDGSLRRVKDKEQSKLALTRFRELKTAHDTREAERKAQNEAPLTHVDPKVAQQIVAMMAMGQALPQPPRLHV